MTDYTEAQWAADMELDPEFATAIEDSFLDAVERAADARLQEMAESFDELDEAAEMFLEFVNENEITDEELDDAFDFFCSEVGIEPEDAGLLFDYIAETYSFDEEEADEGIEEAATHVGSWKLAGQRGICHLHDRGAAYATLPQRYVIRHHDKNDKHLATHFASTAPLAQKVIKQLNSGKTVAEDQWERLSESDEMANYVRLIERASGFIKED